MLRARVHDAGMGFLDALKKVAKVVGPVAASAAVQAFPEYGPLVEAGWKTARELEGRYPPGNGTRKAGLWMQAMSARMPDIVRDIEVSTGKRLVDEAGLAAGLADLREAQVKIMKAFREPGL